MTIGGGYNNQLNVTKGGYHNNQVNVRVIITRYVCVQLCVRVCVCVCACACARCVGI